MMATYRLMSVLPFCVFLALKSMMISADTCNQGIFSNQCVKKPPPCGICGEYITINIAVKNIYTEPKFEYHVRVDNEPQQPLIYFLQKAASLNGYFVFSATYNAQYGFMIDTINHLGANTTAKTYWSILSATNNYKPLECGVSTYIPVQEEVIWFNFTSWGPTEQGAAFPHCAFGRCE